MKTKAAILLEQNCPLELAEVEIPKLDYGQVLVEVKVSRICGSQLGEISGVKGPDKWLPHLLGHEGGGIVREVGAEVSFVTPGDHVVMHWRPGNGIESKPPFYKLGSRVINAGFVTTFNDYAVVSENRLTVIPKDVDFEIAALLADTITTGFGAVTRDARVKIGESVIIIGVGGIGLGSVLAAKLAGACPIIGVDIYPHKLDKALEYGLDYAIDSTSCNFVDKISEITGGTVDVVIDQTGSPKVIQNAWQLLGNSGRMVLVGVMKHDLKFSLNTLPLHFGRSIMGSEGGSSRPEIDIPRYLRMIRSREIGLDGFISHRCKLDDVNDAIQLLRSGESIHSIINF